MKRECKTERLVKGLFVLVRDDGGLNQGDSGADDKYCYLQDTFCRLSLQNLDKKDE